MWRTEGSVTISLRNFVGEGIIKVSATQYWCTHIIDTWLSNEPVYSDYIFAFLSQVIDIHQIQVSSHFTFRVCGGRGQRRGPSSHCWGVFRVAGKERRGSWGRGSRDVHAPVVGEVCCCCFFRGWEWADNIKGLQKSSGKLTVVFSSMRQKHHNKNKFSHLYISLIKFCTFLQI